jgi:sulfatase modifying factor 1
MATLNLMKTQTDDISIDAKFEDLLDKTQLQSKSPDQLMPDTEAEFGLTKPDWATRMGRDSGGLWIEFKQHGKVWRVYWPEWGTGLDHDKVGLYIDLTIKGITQRCRWIPPGTFLMGSPISEKERYNNETQHQVTLTHGYWLADTACTQALWRAVMGENPACFRDDHNNPVEMVSWSDVQHFIKQLNTLIPGLAAQLPSEAQWEYACRAGTTTPFSFGKTITPEQVNYDGNAPYAGGKKGLYREKTVPVKSLPANSWGLYEMHGNVWEWCADWYDDYPETSVTDPTGSETGSSRVLRGGSWSNYGWRTRSANRGWYTPVNLDYYIGFRFVLGQAS